MSQLLGHSMAVTTLPRTAQEGHPFTAQKRTMKRGGMDGAACAGGPHTRGPHRMGLPHRGGSAGREGVLFLGRKKKMNSNQPPRLIWLPQPFLSPSPLGWLKIQRLQIAMAAIGWRMDRSSEDQNGREIHDHFLWSSLKCSRAAMEMGNTEGLKPKKAKSSA